jgi:hypothetical protein
MRYLLLIITLALAFWGCNNETDKSTEPKSVLIENFEIIADTIINDVIIKNPDNDEWTDFTLRKLDKTSLVNHIFDAVYEKKLIPYDFFNNTPLTIDDIRNLEKDPEFSRENIAKVQYEEAWYYNKEDNTMIKKVHSIMLAYEIYNNQGGIKGYKPAFKVYFNDQSDE